MPSLRNAQWDDPAPVSWVLDRAERLPLLVSVGGLFLVSLALRLYFQNDGLFLYDSVVLAQAVEDTLETGRLHGQINGRHGSVLFGLLAYLPDYLITGEASAERALLGANAFWSAAAVPALFFLGNSLLRNAGAAWIAAFLFSLSPIYLSVSTWAKPHGLEVFQIVASFALLAGSRSRNTISRLLMASIVMGSAIFCREAALLLLPIYVLMYLQPEIAWRRPFVRVDPRVWSIRWLAAAFMPLALLLAVSLWFYLGDVVLRTLTVESQNTVAFPLVPTPILWMALGDLAVQLTPLGIALSIVGVACLTRRANVFAFVVLGAWAAILYPVGNSPAYWPRLLAVLSPPFFLCLGLGASWLYKRSRLVALLVVLFVGTHMLYTIVPILSYRRVFSGEKAQALWLREHVPAGGVVIAMDDSIFIDYYAGLETLEYPLGDPAATEKWIADLKERVLSGTPVYVINSTWNYDFTMDLRRGMSDHFHLEKVGTKVVEDYHRAALRDLRYRTTLQRLRLGKRGS